MTVTVTPIPVGTWTVDPVHSTTEFSVKHLISTFRAGFEEVSGRPEVGEGGVSLEGSVPVESLSIKQPDLRSHVLGPDSSTPRTTPQSRSVRAR